MKIKYSFLFITFFVVFTSRVFSQGIFVEGGNLINFGAGYGNLYYSGYGGADNNYRTTPALTISIDHGFKKLPQIQGTIGLGGLIGFVGSSAGYTYDNGDFYKHGWNDFIIAGRAAYHAGFLNTDKFDLYGGLMLGLRIESYDFASNYLPNPNTYGGVFLTGGVFVGGVYYLVNNLGAFAELGYDISYVKVGLSLKTGVGKPKHKHKR